MRAILVLAAAFAGCGTLGGDHGGGEELPNRGIIPYEKVTEGDAGLAFVVPAPEAARLDGPSAVADDGVALFVAVREGERSRVVRADSADGLTFGPTEDVLAADRPLAGPSVLRAAGRWHMAVTLDDGAAIGHARSDDGRRFTLDAAPLLAAEGPDEAGGIDGPSLVADGEGFRLYYAARAEAGGPQRILLAVAGADLRFERRGVVLGPGADCVDFQGAAKACWDAESVGAPEVRRARTATGREVWRLFYAGRRGDTSGLGFAASEDGLSWSRFAHNPVLGDGAERDPTNVRHDERYLLYFLQGRRPLGVAAAVDERGLASEAF